MINVLDVAKFIIYKSKTKPTLNRLMLMLYYAQGYNLGEFRRRLFVDEIKVLDKRPIIQAVVDNYDTLMSEDTEIPHLTHRVQKDIEFLIEGYEDFDDARLYSIACKEKLLTDTPDGHYINRKAMREFFHHIMFDVGSEDEERKFWETVIQKPTPSEWVRIRNVLKL